ncbi:MAG: DUF3488 and transglutaminase-like domain-containing protein [Myxococcota bacterium]
MTFERLHKLVLYATVTVGLLPLATSGELPIPFVIATFAGIIVSWMRDTPLERIAASERFWTVLTVVALLILGGLAFVTTNYLLYAILFVLVLVVTRLFQSRSSRDVFQLYGLSFMAVTAGAIINPALAFLGIFFVYIILLVWGLILLHIQRDIEGLQAEQTQQGERPRALAWQARDLVSRRFLVGSSALALGIFAASLFIFFFFPRLGIGMFFGQGRQTQSMSGFSDKIELGHFGNIKDNMEVVMRVELPDDRERTDMHLRLRGISLDKYSNGLWEKSVGPPWAMSQTEQGSWVSEEYQRVRGRIPKGEILRQSIYLEPLSMDTRMVFGVPRIMRLTIDNPTLQRFRGKRALSFFQDTSDDISTKTPSDVALRYEVESWQPRGLDPSLRLAKGEIPKSIKDRFLQLPADLDPRIAELANELSAGATNDFDRARAIEQRLSKDWTYTTQGGEDSQRPLEEFLFVRKKGHCEYFATGMAVMLRTLGIPARPANGFFGGAYNTFGRFYTIRQADAHAWVEVWFPGHGWVTFDPTPASAVLVPPEIGALAALKEAYDSFKLQWFKWIVEYDFEKQLEVLRRVGSALSGLRDLLPKPSGGSVSNPGAWKRGLKEWMNQPTTWALLASPLVLWLLNRLGVFGWLRRKLARLFKRRGPTPGGEVGLRYQRMLTLLARQGIGRGTGETPRELATRLARQSYPASDAVERVTAAFEAVRYAEREPTQAVITALDKDVDAIKRARVA